MMAVRAHLRVDVINIDRRRIAEIAIDEYLSLEIRGNIECAGRYLKSCSGSGRSKSGKGGGRIMSGVIEQRSVGNDSGFRRSGIDPIVNKFLLADRKLPQSQRHAKPIFFRLREAMNFHIQKTLVGIT